MKNKGWNPIKEQPKDRSLDDKAYDLFGELLLEQETNKLLDEIEEEKAWGASAEMDAFFATHNDGDMQRIEQYFRRQRVKKLLTKTLLKMAQVAAVFIACISMVGSIVLATNETARVYVMRLITTMSEEYTSLKLAEDEATYFDVPVDWKGRNYPSYIPSDLQVSSVYSYLDNNSVEHISVKSGELQMDFAELGSGTETNVDTEGAAIHTIMVRDYPGFVAIKELRISIYWSNGQDYFILETYDLDKAIAVQIAESVKNIR